MSNALQQAAIEYTRRRWRVVPVHVPLPDGGCSCGKPKCNTPGKHPRGGDGWAESAARDADAAARLWGTASPPNIGVITGADSADLADVDRDCEEAILAGAHLLPETHCTFGRGGLETHALYTVTDGAAEFIDMKDPVIAGKGATVIELRWSCLDAKTGRVKAHQTVIPPSLHYSQTRLEWLRDGDPGAATGAELAAAVRRVGAAVLIARYARPNPRHDLVLLLANLGVRAGWDDDAVLRFILAVFAARKDGEMLERVAKAEGRGAVEDARKRVEDGERMYGLPYLAKTLDPALTKAQADEVVGRVKGWLGIPDRDGPTINFGGSASARQSAAPRDKRTRYLPLPAFRPFPLDALPAVIRSMAEAVAGAMDCDPVYFIPHALAVAGGMIGRTRTLKIKRSWREPAIVWAGVIADSGGIKSPPYKAAIAPVVDLEAKAYQAFKLAKKEYQKALREYKRTEKDADSGDPPEEPIRERFAVGDVTVEKLARILDQSPNRMLDARDEMAGWIGGFNQYKKQGGADRANWLELHQLGTIIIDRVTGDVGFVVPQVGCGVCGTIQPGTLRRQMTAENMDSGIMARLLLAYPPPKLKQWSEVDLPEQVENDYANLVKTLAKLEPGTLDDGEGGRQIPIALSMTDGAKRVWVEYFNRHARRQFLSEGHLASAMAKLEAYAARLALIHHVCESITTGADGFTPDVTRLVTEASMRAGVAMAEWFVCEAVRVYSMLGETPDEVEVRRLVDHVRRLAGKSADGKVRPRDMQRSDGSRYRVRDDAAAALQRLASLGLGVWDDAERHYTPHPTPDKPDSGPEDGGVDDDWWSDDPPDNPPSPCGDGPAGECAGDDAKTGTTTSCGGGSEGGSERVSDLSGVGSNTTPPNQSTDGGLLPESPSGGLSGKGNERDSPGPRRPESGATVSSNTEYTLVTSPDGLPAVVAAVESAGSVGLDVETVGLDPRTGRVRLLQVATPDRVFLIDLFTLPNPATDLADLFAALAQVEVIGHNLQFDLRFLAPLGFAPGRTFCTMLASQLLYAGHRGPNGVRLKHSLLDVAQRELGKELDKTHQAADWSKPLTPAQLAYAATDAAVLLPLAEALRAKLADATFGPAVNIEMAALPGVAWAAPVAVDREAWLARAESAEAEWDRLAEEMDALAPNPGTLTSSRNWNSPEQVKAAFAALGIPVEGTDDDHLAALDHPLAGKLREYRSAQKQVGTYGKGWLADHAPAGEVLPSWRQLGAESGRMSCTDPNLQQIPRGLDYRRCFVARPGRVLVKADYSQVELRIAAKIADEPAMIAAYRDGKDLHALTASAVLGKPVEGVTKADRQLAKAVNFGLLFGMGWKSLKVYARANYGVTLTDDEARRYRDAFFRAYPKLRSWHRRVGGHVENLFKKDPAATHETRTLADRRRVLPVAKGTAERRYPNVTEALNTPVQGTGADGLKMAIGLLWERRAECPGVVPVLFCHDEIVLEAPADAAERAANWLKAAMVDAMSALLAPVPVEVEVTVGRTWGGN
jgi:DNA polymerase-1